MSGAAYFGMAGFQIISGIHQAESIRASARLAREISEMNAQSAELDAYHAEQDGMTEEARYQSVIDQTIGAQRVGFAAQDIDINFGTAKSVQEETKLVGFLNQLDMRNAAHAKALGYKNQAANYRLAGAMGEMEASINASAVQSSAMMNAAGNVAQGLSGYNFGSKSKVSVENGLKPVQVGDSIRPTGGHSYASYTGTKYAVPRITPSYLGNYKF